jgi:hypothetical protein
MTPPGFRTPVEPMGRGWEDHRSRILLLDLWDRWNNALEFLAELSSANPSDFPTIYNSITFFPQTNPLKQRPRLCVANCHLEGDPRQPMARVAQVRSALQEAARRGGPRGHALVLAGDMNARLGGSS